MNRMQQRVGGRARPLKKQSNGVVILGLCLLVGLGSIAGAVVYTNKSNRDADAAKAKAEAAEQRAWAEKEAQRRLGQSVLDAANGK